MIEPLGGANLETKKRGRPSEITDVELFHRRYLLLGIFEFHWAEIAWELERAKTLKDVRCSLQPIPEPRRSDLDLFLHEPTEKTTAKSYRELRRVKKDLESRLHSVIPKAREAKDFLETVEGAIRDAAANGDTERWLHDYQKRANAAQRLVADLQLKIDNAWDHLQQQGAFTAQTGLLDFIRSQRYKLSPLTYANAMAGLPFIHWRQSTVRCQRAPISHQFSSVYELFLELKRAMSPAPTLVEDAVEQVRTYLLSKKHQSQHPPRTLREEWYYVRSGIETAYAQSPPSSAIPFRAFAMYQRRASARSQLDLVLSTAEKL